MKKSFHSLGIIALVAVIILFMVGCPMNPEEESGISATELPTDGYLDGAITSSTKEQWFKFTASTSKHYIHVRHGTLSDFSVQLYDSNEEPVNSRIDYHQSELSGYGGWYSEITVTSGKVYYLKVTPYSSSNMGTYRIGCWTGILSSEDKANAKTLTFSAWVSGTYTKDSDDNALYKFTATSVNSHYVHIEFGTLTQMYVRLYDSNGSIVVDRTTMTSDGYIRYQFLTSGSVYYVSPWSTNNNGTYRIALNTSTTAP
jgi:hypothetical protein